MTEMHDVVVVGGGLTGLTVAQQLRASRPELSLAVIERADRVGGIVGSSREHGFTVDTGPHGFVVYGPAGVSDLATELGLGPEMLVAEEAAERLYLLRDDERLELLPTSVREFLGTSLLTWSGKLRALAEVAVPRRPDEEDFYSFVRRRFGRQMAHALAVPAVLGVTGGDARFLSVDAKFPSIREMEAEHRSILLGALRYQLALQRAAGRWWPKLPDFAEFGTRLHSFRGHGMQMLIDALEKAVAGTVRLGTEVRRIERGPDDQWEIRTTGGGRLAARHLVLALPAYLSARLIQPLLPAAAAGLARIPHPDVRVVALGYRRADVPKEPDGIGFLTIPTPRTHILGTIHTSTIFPEQAPPDAVLIRTLAGGVQDPGFSELSREDAVATVHEDLRRVFGIRGEPIFAFDRLWRDAIPEYQIGHRRLVGDVLAAVRTLPGLHLAGNAYSGVGINDCVRDARRATREVLRSTW